MYTKSLHVSVSWFRHRVWVWISLMVFSSVIFPSLSEAQQPTATLRIIIGTVLVNGQPQDTGVQLNTGDVIETQAETTVVLTLSDGSLLELSANTKISLAELKETSTGARVSLLKILWGRIRAKLSPDHQRPGSRFDIETPNALVGVKFSQPDVEVSYDPVQQETVVLALTVALVVKNLITDEEKMIPIGSMAIISTLGIKVMAGAAATGIIGTEPSGATTAAAGAASAGTTGGIGTGTMIAVGAGVAAAGGIAAVVASSDDGSSGNGSDNNGSDKGDDGYSTSDLQGTWNWIRIIEYGGADSGQISLDSRGNITNFVITGESRTVSFNGTATVSPSGVVNGIVSDETAEPGETSPSTRDTTTFQGTFVSDNRIEGTFITERTDIATGFSIEYKGTLTLTRLSY